MQTSHSHLSSHWVLGLQDGDDEAAEALWNRYFTRLVSIADAKLGGLTHDLGGEDIALSAIKSLVVGARERRFPQLADPTALWPLLLKITARKAISEQRRQFAKKRDRQVEYRLDDLAEYLGDEPTEALVVEVRDQLNHLCENLKDHQLRQIVEMRLAGFTQKEIAIELECSTRTIIRKLELIQREWLALESASLGDPASPEPYE